MIVILCMLGLIGVDSFLGNWWWVVAECVVLAMAIRVQAQASVTISNLPTEQRWPRHGLKNAQPRSGVTQRNATDKGGST
ncbi:MAG TPA: hypothetical protein VJ608_12805 [Albitalea sp.]|nr:hypothetical protein [Albitalea sp.]